MNVIIVGYGRVGASIAKLLTGPDNNLTVIDNDPKALARVDADFPGRVVLGLGFDEDVLVEAGIHECDALAAVTSSDNVNLMASEVARRLYNVPHVITRLINPARLDVYEQLGLDYVCDTEIVAEDISAKIRSQRAHHLDTLGEYEVLSFSLKTPRATTVREFEGVCDVRIMLIQHDGTTIKATPNIPMEDGDTVLAVVKIDDLRILEKHMRS